MIGPPPEAEFSESYDWNKEKQGRKSGIYSLV